jgi:hypothetical protein
MGKDIEACFKRHASHVPNALETIDNMPVYLGFFAGSQKKFAVSPARSKLAHFT